jgi:hypothetical protein
LFWRGQASLTIFPFVLSRARALRLQLSMMVMISGVNLSHRFTSPIGAPFKGLYVQLK